MMAGRLPVQVVDDQLEAGSLHVGGHPAAHGAQPDEPHRHVALGHPFTVAAISDFGPHRKGSRGAENAEGPPAQKATSVMTPVILSALGTHWLSRRATIRMYLGTCAARLNGAEDPVVFKCLIAGGVLILRPSGPPNFHPCLASPL